MSFLCKYIRLYVRMCLDFLVISHWSRMYCRMRLQKIIVKSCFCSVTRFCQSLGQELSSLCSAFTKTGTPSLFKEIFKRWQIMHMALYFQQHFHFLNCCFFISLGRPKGLSIQLFLQQSRLFEAEDEVL